MGNALKLIAIILLLFLSSCSSVSFITIGQINRAKYIDKEFLVKTGIWLECKNDTIIIVRYKDNIMDGKIILIYPVGAVEKGHYKNGRKDGVFKIYSGDGRLIKKIWYEDGTEIKKRELFKTLKDPPF